MLRKILTVMLMLISIMGIASASEVPSNGKMERSFDLDVVVGNDTNVRFVDVTVYPSPYGEFNFPGYMIYETLPSGFEYITSNAQYYQLWDNQTNTIRMLRFVPTSGNSSLTYRLKFPNVIGDYTFSGRFQDKSRNNGTTSGDSVLQITSLTPSVKIFSTKQINVTDEPIEKDTSMTPIIINSVIVIIIVVIGLVIYKRTLILKQIKIELIDKKLFVDGAFIETKGDKISFDFDSNYEVSSKVVGNIRDIVTISSPRSVSGIVRLTVEIKLIGSKKGKIVISKKSIIHF